MFCDRSDPDTIERGGDKIHTARKAVRKYTERCFGVLKARFKVLRVDNNFWYREDVAGMTEICIIIQNLLVRMAQKGLFEGEIEDEDGNVNKISQFYQEEQSASEKLRCTQTEDAIESNEMNTEYTEKQLDEVKNEFHVTEDMMKCEADHWEMNDELLHS